MASKIKARLPRGSRLSTALLSVTFALLIAVSVSVQQSRPASAQGPAAPVTSQSLGTWGWPYTWNNFWGNNYGWNSWNNNSWNWWGKNNWNWWGNNNWNWWNNYYNSSLAFP